MFGYRTRVANDIERWQQAGWLTAEGAGAIRADLDARGQGRSLPQILALLGGVLLCFGAMTFVASNWQALSKLARLAILFGAMWGCYAAAAVLFQRQLAGFAQAAVLAGTGVFGAAIMLIAQMYHMDGNPPDAVLLWAGGAALAGVALRSNSALVLAVLLLVLWSGWEHFIQGGVHWAFLPAWAGLTALSLAVTRWLPLYHLLALALAAWAVALGGFLPNYPHHHVTALLGLLAVAAGAYAGPLIEERLAAAHRPAARTGSRLATVYGLATAFAGLWLMQFSYRNTGLPAAWHGSTAALIILALLTLALLLGSIAWGLRHDDRAVLWLGYAGFSIELVSLYFKTLGTLLDTSLFFLSAGALVIGLSWVAWKLHGRSGNARPPAMGAPA